MIKAAGNKRTTDQVSRAVLILFIAFLAAGKASPSSAMAGLAGPRFTSSVEISEGVRFRKYQLASMLDQVFTLATDMKEGAPYEMRQDEHGSIAIVK